MGYYPQINKSHDFWNKFKLIWQNKGNHSRIFSFCFIIRLLLNIKIELN
jgi:hypothetical protein